MGLSWSGSVNRMPRHDKQIKCLSRYKNIYGSSMTAHITWVRSFEAAARCGSLTTAGADLGLTQAAISQHIKALESHLRVQLFTREARGVSLTGAGSELYLEVVEGLHQIDRALQRYRPSKTGDMFVLCNTSLMIRWLLPRLPAFCQQYPGISLRVGTTLRRTDAFGLQSDVELFLAPATGDTRTRVVAPGDMAAVCAPRVAATCLRDLRSGAMRLATVVSYEAMYQAWIEAVPGKPRKAPATLTLDSFYAALALTEAEQAVTICPRLLASDALNAGKLVEVAPVPDAPKLHYWSDVRDMKNESAVTFNQWVSSQLSSQADNEMAKSTA